MPTKHSLKEPCQFAFSKWDVTHLHPKEANRNGFENGTYKPDTLNRLVSICMYLQPWLFRSAAIHLPRISNELFILPASFRRSPNVLVLLHLSEPARSQSERLMQEKRGVTFKTTCVSKHMHFTYSDSP